MMPANDAPARQDDGLHADAPRVLPSDPGVSLVNADLPTQEPAPTQDAPGRTPVAALYSEGQAPPYVKHLDTPPAGEPVSRFDPFPDAMPAPPVVVVMPVKQLTVAAPAVDLLPRRGPKRAPQPAAEPVSEPAAAAPAPAAPPEALKPRREDLLNAVERLRMQVATLPLTLDVGDVRRARRERESLLSQLDDYLLPRLRRPDAPLLAVIGGSTGAGKSTLTNSLVRREVSRSGVLRPTTRSPVLIHHPYDSGAFMTQRILPRLERITSEGAEPLQPIDPHAPRITGLRLVPHDGLTPGMALIDAPDIDSLVETNRDLAVQLLGAADLWIFVTTAARYADAMPWEMLKQAADRGVAVAVVLDRVPPEVLPDLRVHLATRLRDRGLGGAPLFTVPETQVGLDGFLPERVVQPLLTWLRRVAGDERSRRVIADRTLKGVAGSIPARAQMLAQAAASQAHAWVALHEDIDSVFSRSNAALLAVLTDGSLLSGDVRARWEEHIADGGLIRQLDGGSGNLGNLGNRVTAAIRRDGDPPVSLDMPVAQAISASIQAAARSAVDQIATRWQTRPGGPGLLAERGQLIRNANVGASVDRSLNEWRRTVVDAASELAELPTGEQSVDPDALVDVLFVATIDASTDGEHTANPAVAAARRIVGTFTSDEEITSVITAARADLMARASAVLDGERARLQNLLDAGGTDARRGEALLAAANAVEQAGSQ